MRTSWRKLKQDRHALTVAFVFGGAIKILMLSTEFYTLQIFERVVPFDSIGTLVVLTAITALASVAGALIETARDTVLLGTGCWPDHGLGRHLLENGSKSGATPAEPKQDQGALAQMKSLIVLGGATPLFAASWTPILLLTLVLLHPLIGDAGVAAGLLRLVTALLPSLDTARLQTENVLTGECTRIDQLVEPQMRNLNRALHG